MTKRETGYILTAIAAIYNTQFDDYKVQLWHNLIGDLDYKKAEYVTSELLQTLKFPPTPADIREAYFSPAIKPLTATEASALVFKSLSMYGRYRAIEAMEFLERENEIIYRIVHNIGFYNVCNSDPNYLRGEIERKYAECVKALSKETLLSDKLKEERDRLYADPSTEECKQIMTNTIKKLTEIKKSNKIIELEELQELEELESEI